METLKVFERRYRHVAMEKGVMFINKREIVCKFG
jgi:hypothetical protein